MFLAPDTLGYKRQSRPVGALEVYDSVLFAGVAWVQIYWGTKYAFNRSKTSQVAL